MFVNPTLWSIKSPGLSMTPGAVLEFTINVLPADVIKVLPADVTKVCAFDSRNSTIDSGSIES